MAIPNPNPNIADGIKSDNKTYSSNKIESLIKTATELPTPEAGDAGKVLTVNSDSDGYELDTPVDPTSIIDDTTAELDSVYSSKKVDALLGDKQDKSDSNLTTTNKQIVPAINELNTLSVVSFTSNNKLTTNGVNIVRYGKFILIVGNFRGTTLTANENIFQLNDVNISSNLTTVFIPINGNFGTNYVGYLKAENSGTGINIFTDVALDNASLLFINAIIPIN